MEPELPPGMEGPSEADEPLDFVRAGIFFYGAMAIVAVLWRVGLYQEPVFFFSREAEAGGLQLGRDLAIGAGTGVFIILLSSLMTRFTRWGDELAREMAMSLGPLSVPNAVLLACASGLAEEMFFRGALQPRVGWFFASLLFGAVHFVPRRVFLPWTGFAIAVGFLFGGLFQWTGNLLAPIVAHTLVNGVNLPILVKHYGESSTDQVP